jgi:hypothetical protein
LTTPPRPLDDLTRDLRARTLRKSARAIGNDVPDIYAPLIDPLTTEAADAIDRLCVDLNRFGTAVQGYAAATGAFVGDDVFEHLAWIKSNPSVADAIYSVANLYFEKITTLSAQQALAGLRRVVEHAGYEMLAPSEAAARRAKDSKPSGFVVPTSDDVHDEVYRAYRNIRGDENVPKDVEQVLDVIIEAILKQNETTFTLIESMIPKTPDQPNRTRRVLGCALCGASGKDGDYCRCDPEENLPRDAPKINTAYG